MNKLKVEDGTVAYANGRWRWTNPKGLSFALYPSRLGLHTAADATAMFRELLAVHNRSYQAGYDAGILRISEATSFDRGYAAGIAKCRSGA